MVDIKDRICTQACANCGQAPGSSDPYNRIEVDHIFPVARGGKDEDNNYQPLCGICNRYKADWTNEECRDGVFPEWRMHSPYAGGYRPYPTDFNRTTEEWTIKTFSRGEWIEPTLYIYGKLFDVPVSPSNFNEWEARGLRSRINEEIVPFSADLKALATL